MDNLEKVLHGLNSCGFCDGIPNVCGVTECPYESDSPWCTHYLAHDAGELIGELLKTQEPVSVKKKQMKMGGLQTWNWVCGNCGQTVLFSAKFCPWCGRAVKWG